MKTIVILLPVSNKDNVGRTELEHIENERFTTRKALHKAVGTEHIDLYTMSEFMDLCNNQEFDEASWWIGYVRVPKKFNT